MEATKQFRTQIRRIQQRTELEIINTILDHYRPLFKTLCEKSNQLTSRLEHLNQMEMQLGLRLGLGLL